MYETQSYIYFIEFHLWVPKADRFTTWKCTWSNETEVTPFCSSHSEHLWRNVWDRGQWWHIGEVSYCSSFAYTCLQHILDHHLAGCIAICVTYMWAMSTTDMFIEWTVQFHNFILYLLGCAHCVRVWCACVSECTNIMYIIAAKY